MKSNAFHVIPCFSTGKPVKSEAIVGNRNGGLTALAFHVTDPSLTSRLRTGMAPLFSDSFPTPSRTNKITCSGDASAFDFVPLDRAGAAIVQLTLTPVRTTTRMAAHTRPYRRHDLIAVLDDSEG